MKLLKTLGKNLLRVFFGFLFLASLLLFLMVEYMPIGAWIMSIIILFFSGWINYLLWRKKRETQGKLLQRTLFIIFLLISLLVSFTIVFEPLFFQGIWKLWHFLTLYLIYKNHTLWKKKKDK